MYMALNFESQFEFENSGFCVRPICHADIQTLRVWRNANRQFFHHQEIISEKEQELWFANFAGDVTRQLFICERKNESIACVGFQTKTGEKVELFNLICGHPLFLGSGFMSCFFASVQEQLVEKGVREIILEVLKNNNRAIHWYFKQGFTQIGQEEKVLKLLLKIK